MKLKFPVVLYIDRKLDVDDGVGLRARGVSFPDERTMVCKETVQNHKPGWLLDADGNFRTLTPKGKRREWARPLSSLWRFTQSEYEMSAPKLLKVGEFKRLLGPVKDHFAEARTAATIRRSLETFNDDAVLTADLLSRLNL